MITGLGNAFVQPNSATPGGSFPPFPINAADNGLSVDPITGRIVLGNAFGEPGDPGQLITNRLLRLVNNILSFGDPALDLSAITIDPVAGSIAGWADIFQLAKLTAPGISMLIDEISQLYIFGAYGFGHGNGTVLVLNDPIQQVTLGTPSATSLFMDGVFQTASLGTGNAGLDLNGALQNQSFTLGGNSFQRLNRINGQYFFGDIDNVVGGGILTFNDLTGRAVFNAGTTVPAAVLLDNLNGESTIGDAFSVQNGTKLRIQDDFLSAAIEQGTNTGLALDFPGRVFGMGDLNVGFNGTAIFVKDQLTQVVTNGTRELIGTQTVYDDFSGALLATLNNSPVLGDPSKWLKIDDAGTTRFIPTW